MNQELISYVNYEAIDTDQWDRCLDNAPNSLIYARSWYLDKLCDRWDALVMGNYRYVMPLTYRQKFGIRYLYQPLFCQQLGIFPTPTREVSQLFLQEVARRFSFAEINLNAMQLPVDSVGGYEKRQNLLLSLVDSYEVMAGNYSQHTRRKLKKASKHQLILVSSISAGEYLRFKKKNQQVRLSEKEMQKLRNILAFALSRSLGQIYGVYSPGNELCAAAFFIRDKYRVTYLSAISSAEGKKYQAMYFLIDRFIQENAGKEYLLDFEGSQIPGVARLYKGFGASPEKYHHYRYNRLPWWSKWLKK
ncbi:hypothetical protein [uncultured Sunxiuqinia sp.]|uniref:hypothetical protein n=1 Tax=uncultured Sunxiuqinia sp. TaxID=1573825 RepID=UPI0026291E89|nr:hypothetical protein [uncultured Sunxiuqinia sp.]